LVADSWGLEGQVWARWPEVTEMRFRGKGDWSEEGMWNLDDDFVGSGGEARGKVSGVEEGEGGS